jgi:hypothetical protein
MSYCSAEQLDRVSAVAIESGRWALAGLVLNAGVSETRHKEVVEEASKRAEERDFINCILPHCTDDQLESALTHLVSRRLWESVGLVLKRSVSDTQHMWAVEEASKRAEERDFINCILPH